MHSFYSKPDDDYLPVDSHHKSEDSKHCDFNDRDFLKGSRYEPLLPIGSGTFSVVWAARHKRSHNKVAIKHINNPFDSKETTKFIYREIRIMRHLSHENVMGLLDVIELENTNGVMLVMELMDTDLGRVIISKAKLSETHYQLFTYQILRGLKYIHSANIIHRDLKPQNCLVNKNCDLKITDFGMGRDIVHKPDVASQENVTTLWYRAPEILLENKGISKPIDIWAVGCILGEMIRGRPLFPGRDPHDQLSLILEIIEPESWTDLGSEWQKHHLQNTNQPKKTLEDLIPGGSPQAIDLLSQMLTFEPEKRLTCEKALRHPFFDELHDSEDEPMSENQISMHGSAENYKALILKELQSIHDSHL